MKHLDLLLELGLIWCIHLAVGYTAGVVMREVQAVPVVLEQAAGVR